MRSARLAVVLDIGCVLVFVIIGRASHAKGESLAGIASTAWPFLTGLAGGWLAARAWRGPFGLVPRGLGAWLGAVAVGMVLRVVSGQGTAVAFIGVALAFLGLFLLGWRLVARLFRRVPERTGLRRGRSPPSGWQKPSERLTPASSSPGNEIYPCPAAGIDPRP